MHRLVRISPFDQAKRRHTSFGSVFVWPELPDDIDIEIPEKDLRIDTYRSSGAGGQHVNVTDSAVRITHLPTGIVVSCQNERSQHRNRDSAMKVLKARLYDQRLKEQQVRLDQISGEKKDIAFGSQIRSYVLQPYQMVKDHRTKEQVGDVNRVLEGRHRSVHQDIPDEEGRRHAQRGDGGRGVGRALPQRLPQATEHGAESSHGARGRSDELVQWRATFSCISRAITSRVRRKDRLLRAQRDAQGAVAIWSWQGVRELRHSRHHRDTQPASTGHRGASCGSAPASVRRWRRHRRLRRPPPPASLAVANSASYSRSTSDLSRLVAFLPTQRALPERRLGLRIGNGLLAAPDPQRR